MRTETCDHPVFVIGAPRSGTSMMQWCLREHSELWGGPESDFLIPLAEATRSAHAFGSRREQFHWLSRLQVTDNELLGYVGLGINALYTQRSGGLRWVEQTPEYTIHLDDIDAMFPGAQYLFMLRDGRDVVHSLRHFVHPVEHGRAISIWSTFCRSALVWAAAHADSSLLTVRYAEVAADPHQVLPTILAFLGLENEVACADQIAAGRINSSFADAESRDPGWWSWTKRERKEFARGAGDLLVELGFEPDGAWIDQE